jgi:hypothetical protein
VEHYSYHYEYCLLSAVKDIRLQLHLQMSEEMDDICLKDYTIVSQLACETPF